MKCDWCEQDKNTINRGGIDLCSICNELLYGEEKN